MKPASWHLVVECTSELWNSMDKELIIELFEPCTSNLKNDVSEDNLIHCFKDGQTCSAGSKLLRDNLT